MTFFDSCKNADSSWKTKEAKEMDYNNMPLEKKRPYYECGNDYVTLDQVLPWLDYVMGRPYLFTRRGIINVILYH